VGEGDCCGRRLSSYAAAVFSALFEVVGEVIVGLLWRLVPRRGLPAGPVKSATLPSDVTEAVVAALKAGEDPAASLPKGWRSFRTGLAGQDEPEVIARMPIGADLQLAIEPDHVGDRDRVRVERLGYLPPDEELEPALMRGWVRCWLADRRPTERYADGAVILFVAVYDPR
jgi:hypothetical protein